MASPQAEALKDMLRELAESFSGDQEITVEDQREAAEGMAELTGEPDGVTATPADAGGVPALWIEPDGAASDRVILYVHGGGYVVGSVQSHRRLVGHLARAVGCRALSVDYRLAPEHPHPAAVEDSTAAYRWLLAQGVEPAHMAISGDSAGGGLTVSTLVALRDAGTPLPAAGVPLSPWVDMEGTGESMTTRADVDLIVQADGLKIMADHFLAGHDARDPLAAPLYADLSGLPPLYIQVGDEETLLDDSLRLARNAEAAGVEVRVDVFPEMQHVFQMAAGNMPEADDAVARVGDWLRPRLGL